MAVGGLGCPVRFTPIARRRGGAPRVGPSIEGLAAKAVIAHTAHDSDHPRRMIKEKGAVAVIPNNPCGTLKHALDPRLHAQRYLVERRFSEPKRFRRVATRFGKTARNDLAIVTLAGIAPWLR